ncbi:MAG: hypothetical protein ACE5F3_06725 [Mariprofundaceae bacterium]
MNHFCQQASKLVSDAYERTLTLGERLRLRWHMLICGMCRAYERDIRLIERALKKMRSESTDEAALPEQNRQHISQSLREAGNSQGNSSSSS